MKRVSLVTLVLLVVVLTLAGAQAAFAAPKDIGGDGRGDVATMYTYGPGRVAFFVFDSSGVGDTSIVTPRKIWGSLSGWTGSKVTPFLGEVTGDGRYDIISAYDYGSNTTGLIVVPGAAGPSTVRVWWKSLPGKWASSRTKWAITDRMNLSGGMEPVAMYDYGGGTTGIFHFTPNMSSFFPAAGWKSGAGKWWASRSKMIGGDFNGDGRGDLAIMYDYGGGTSGVWLFASNGAGWVPTRIWQSAPGKFPWGNSKLTSGDYDADGTDELLVRYQYGAGGLTGLWNFELGGGPAAPTLLGKTYHFFWSLPVVSSDTDNDGRADLNAWGSGTDDVGGAWDRLGLEPGFDPLLSYGLWEADPHTWTYANTRAVP